MNFRNFDLNFEAQFVAENKDNSFTSHKSGENTHSWDSLLFLLEPVRLRSSSVGEIWYVTEDLPDPVKVLESC